MVADTRGELETAVSDIADDIREFNAEIMNEVSSQSSWQPACALACDLQNVGEGCYTPLYVHVHVYVIAVVVYFLVLEFPHPDFLTVFSSTCTCSGSRGCIL